MSSSRSANANPPTPRLIDCTIEAHSLGDGARALARARFKEIKPNTFSIVPIYLREISGPHVPWSSPGPGEPIETAVTITSFDQAHDMLAWWSTRVLAANRGQ